MANKKNSVVSVTDEINNTGIEEFSALTAMSENSLELVPFNSKHQGQAIDDGIDLAHSHPNKSSIDRIGGGDIPTWNGLTWPSGGEADYLYKNYWLIGDSITSLTGDRSWVEKFKKLVLPASVTNIAVSGARWKETATDVLDGNPTSSANNTISNQVQKAINNQNTYPVPDIIIVFAGMNETTGGTISTSIEQWFSSSDVIIPIDNLTRTNNVPASIRWSLEKLRGLYPLAQVFLVTHYQPAVYAARPAATVKSVRDVMIAVGNRMSIPVIDLYATSGIDGSNELQGAAGKYLIDGLHPNAAGAELICNRIYDAIRSWTYL